MLLGFKDRFAKYVEEGSKTHTIRARRRSAPRVGELCHCYTGLRHKGARLLGRWPCVRVQEIRIAARDFRSKPLDVWIDGVALSPDEIDALFKRDGFRDEGGERYTHTWQAYQFWKDSLPFDGHIIHWKWRRGQ